METAEDRPPQTSDVNPNPRRGEDCAIIQATLTVAGGKFAFDIQGFCGLTYPQFLVMEKVMVNDRNQRLLEMGSEVSRGRTAEDMLGGT